MSEAILQSVITTPIFTSIPEEMKTVKRWVMWRYEEKAGRKTKIPYSDPTTRAKSNDPLTWRYFWEVMKLQELRPEFGIGFVFGDNWAGIDIDHCKLDNGEWDPAALEAALMWNSYTEISPSGTGLHVLIQGRLPEGADKRRDNREIYDSGRYFTVTGDVLPGYPTSIREISDEDMRLLHKRFLPPKEEQTATITQSQTVTRTATQLEDDEIIQKATDAKNGRKFLKLYYGNTTGYDSPSNADQAFVNLLAYWTQDPTQMDRIFRSSRLNRDKWNRDDYRNRTINAALAMVKPKDNFLSLDSNQSGHPPLTNPSGASIGPGLPNGAPKPLTVFSRSPPPADQENPVTPNIEAINQTLKTENGVLDLFRKTFQTLHSGDSSICDLLLLSGALQSCVNCDGLQFAAAGKKGMGKSSAIKAGLHLWPQDYVLTTRGSDKALFYDQRLKPGCCIFSDDTRLSEEQESVLKGAMSSFQTGFQYTTVGKGQSGNEAKYLEIPKRIIFLFTNVSDSGKDELLDRQYRISVSPTKNDHKAFLNFVRKQAFEGIEDLPITKEILLCRDALLDIKLKEFRVRIPFVYNIEFSDEEARRDIKQFFDFIRAVAITNYRNRTVGDESGIIVLIATKADYETARMIFQVSDDTRQFRMTKTERYLVNWLAEHAPCGGIKESELVRLHGLGDSKMSRSQIRRTLYGEPIGTGGICNKVPGVYVEKQKFTERGGDEGLTISQDVNVIFCDSSLKTNLDNFSSFVSWNEPQIEGDRDDRHLTGDDQANPVTPKNPLESTIDGNNIIFTKKEEEENKGDQEKEKESKSDNPSPVGMDEAPTPGPTIDPTTWAEALKLYDLSPTLSLVGYIKMRLTGHHCSVKGCTCSEIELWKGSTYTQPPLCDNCYNILKKLWDNRKEEGTT